MPCDSTQAGPGGLSTEPCKSVFSPRAKLSPLPAGANLEAGSTARAATSIAGAAAVELNVAEDTRQPATLTAGRLGIAAVVAAQTTEETLQTITNSIRFAASVGTTAGVDLTASRFATATRGRSSSFATATRGRGSSLTTTTRGGSGSLATTIRNHRSITAGLLAAIRGLLAAIVIEATKQTATKQSGVGRIGSRYSEHCQGHQRTNTTQD